MESVLPHSPRERASRKWSHEHWLVAGLFGFVGTALIAIVPGFANATRVPAGEQVTARVSLALPLPAVQPSRALAASSGCRSWSRVSTRCSSARPEIAARHRVVTIGCAMIHRLVIV